MELLMKYVLIRYTIGGILFISQVSEPFIVNYEIVDGKKKLINVIDRKKNIEINAITLSITSCESSYSEGWSASRISKEIISKDLSYRDEKFGHCLKLEYKSRSNSFVDDQIFETDKIEVYISRNHSIIGKYCLINGATDWRILNNNPTLEHSDFPFLIHSYIQHENEKTSIFRVLDFEELIYSSNEYKFIIDFLTQIEK